MDRARRFAAPAALALLLGGASAGSALAADDSAPVLRSAPPADAQASTPDKPASAQDVPEAKTSAVGAVWKTSLDSLVASFGRQRGQVDAELACLAMAVHHEAGGQPLKGQLAVAQVIQNRIKSGRFPRTICSVVNQPGQFFSTRHYAVAETSKRWLTALAVARTALLGEAPQVAPGALFFHAASVAPPWGRGRVRIAQIGAQVFYR